MTPIHGTTDPRFQAVRDAFAANFRDHGEVGASLCVYLRGRRVVDLWGGIADLTTGTPWAEDTLQYVFSTSAHGYQAHTFGWLVGEVIRRITGRTPGTFFADEIATPLNRLHRPTPWPPTPGQPTHRTSRRPSPRLHRTTPGQRRHQAPHRPQRPPGPRRRNPLLQRHHHRPRHRPLLQHAHRPDRWLPTTRSRHRHHPPVRRTRPDPRRPHPLRPRLRPAFHPVRGRLFRPRRPRRLTRLRPPARISTKFGLSRRLRHSASSASVSNPLLDMCEPACCRLIRQSWSGSPPEPSRV